MTRLLLSAACAALLAGCAGNRYCIGDQPYSHATSVPPLQPTEGLKLPESSAALKIPPEPAEPVPFGTKTKGEKGKDIVECLDQPPRMPAPAADTEQKPGETKPPA